MKPRDRILDAAMLVFRRQGFRRSSIEQTAEAAGLTRQALYHHFKSKEALFRAVIERVHENALAAEIAAVGAREKAGLGLADILVAGLAARLKQFIGSFQGSPHVEELFSEHLLQARDLYQKYAARYGAQGAATIERFCRRHKRASACDRVGAIPTGGGCESNQIREVACARGTESHHQELRISIEVEFLTCRKISRAAKLLFFPSVSPWEASQAATRWQQTLSKSVWLRRFPDSPRSRARGSPAASPSPSAR